MPLVVKLNDSAIQAIEAILKHGNDAIVYRYKEGVVVSEQTRKTIYRTAQRDAHGEGNQSHSEK